MVNDKFNGIIQINSVTLGAFGGAVFSGKFIGSNKIQVCKASYKILVRTPIPGECYKVQGTITSRDQFKNFITVYECNVISLPVAAYIERFLLKHPAFRGFYFGKAKVKLLVDTFGAEVLVRILNTADVTILSKAISIDLARKIINTWQSIQNEISTISFCIENKISISIAYRILKVCKINTVERIKKNIYGLVAFRGIEKKIWETIEELRLKLSIEDSDEKRLIGAVEYALYGQLDQGHTACFLSDLKNLIYYYLKDKNLVESSLATALANKVICIKNVNNQILVQPIGIAIIESEVEKQLRILNSHNSNELNTNELSKKIARYSDLFKTTNGYCLTNEQKLAVMTGLSHRLSLITGYAGSGKTTILNAIVDLYKSDVFIMALSGKAKERARAATDLEHTYTIHNFIQKLRSGPCSLDLSNDPLIIIDEASMVDITLINQLLSILKVKCKSFNLLMMGDPAQLAPVGIGLVFHKLIQSDIIPTVHLTEIHRTTAEGDLHKIAMQIRRGKLEHLQIWSGQEEGVFLVECASKSKDLCQTLHKLKIQLPDAQIITTTMTARYADSGNTINEYIQHAVNKNQNGIQIGSAWLKINDPVIVTKNSYKHFLFNGNTGLLVNIEYDGDGSPVGTFLFDNTTYYLRTTDCFELGVKLAYAISIHKSQGSEYQNSIICAVNPTPLFERSMLYTAVTRSKKLSLIVGDYKIAKLAAERANRADQLCVGFTF